MIPSLSIERKDVFSGTVERVESLTKPNVGKVVAEAIGSCVALWCWLGLTDLHADNIRFGEINGKMLFFPIDVEAMFFNLLTLNDTLLVLPPAHIGSRDVCGLGVVAASLSRQYISDFAAGMRETLNFLSDKSNAFLDAFPPETFAKDPCRVILRPTSEYALAMSQSESVNTKVAFCSEEMEQMNRNDIPYFFKFLGREDIHYFNEPQKFGLVRSDLSKIYYVNDLNFQMNWSVEKIDIFVLQAECYLNEKCS